MARALTGADRLRAITGALLGTAIGDAIGLPWEGLSRARAARLRGPGPLAHGLVLARGLLSDDGEHACMTAQALIASGGDADAFASSMAWRLRGWLLGLPAGVGFGTLRAILRLWIGIPPSRSGVASAGNGPCMRAPVIGAWAAGDDRRLQALTLASTRVTHRDPQAEAGAALVARAAAIGARESPDDVRQATLALLAAADLPSPLREACATMGAALERGEAAAAFADRLGCERGVSGYVAHTVPVALFCHLRHLGDFRSAVESAARLGVDTDTVGAVTGGLAGAVTGADGIPSEWVGGLADWPRSVAWIRRVAERLAECVPGVAGSPVRLFWPGLVLRSPAFLAIVLGHGVRRLFPPY